MNFTYGETKYDSLNNQLKALSKSIEKIDNQYKTLISKQEWKNNILEERLKQASETISNQNSLLSNIGLIYTITSILIALFGIALPIILTYLFSIRPSQEAIENLKKDVDKKVEQYLINSKNNQIKEIIDNLKNQSNNPTLRHNAINFLYKTRHEMLYSEQQIWELIQLIKLSNDTDIKYAIAHAISNKETAYTTEYFTEILKNPQNKIKHAAINYFATIGIDNHIDTIRNFINASTDRYTDFVILIANIANTHRPSIGILINEQQLIDLLDKSMLKKIENELQNQKINWQLDDSVLINSYLYKKMKDIE